jgi:hypothetical protein
MQWQEHEGISWVVRIIKTQDSSHLTKVSSQSRLRGSTEVRSHGKEYQGLDWWNKIFHQR